MRRGLTILAPRNPTFCYRRGFDVRSFFANKRRQIQQTCTSSAMETLKYAKENTIKFTQKRKKKKKKKKKAGHDAMKKITKRKLCTQAHTQNKQTQ